MRIGRCTPPGNKDNQELWRASNPADYRVMIAYFSRVSRPFAIYDRMENLVRRQTRIAEQQQRETARNSERSAWFETKNGAVRRRPPSASTRNCVNARIVRANTTDNPRGCARRFIAK